MLLMSSIAIMVTRITGCSFVRISIIISSNCWFNSSRLECPSTSCIVHSIRNAIKMSLYCMHSGLVKLDKYLSQTLFAYVLSCLFVRPLFNILGGAQVCLIKFTTDGYILTLETFFGKIVMSSSVLSIIMDPMFDSPVRGPNMLNVQCF